MSGQKEVCPECDGEGYFEDEYSSWDCSFCDGKGYIIIEDEEEFDDA